MKVLISGIAGFLGTHVAEYYRKKGWAVIGIDNLTDFELKRAKFDITKSRRHNLEFLHSIGVDFYKADIRHIDTFPFKDIDYIIHCAAQPAMTIAIEHPDVDMGNNILGTLNMLEIARELKIPFANCSSIHVYGNNINSSLIEEATRFVSDPPTVNEERQILNGDLTPLHVSKRATELYTQCYAETYGLRTVSFRLTGMYGERQFGGMDHGWVANFAIRTVMERPITVFDTDKQVRDILYASDAAAAFDKWFENGKSGIYNIGGGMENSISIKECLDKLQRITSKSQDITFGNKRFGDLYYFVCDYKKAYKDFGWRPTIDPDMGLRKLINWVEDNKEIL